MTFDGRIAPPSERPSPARRWGAIAAFAGVVLAAAAVAGIMRSRNPGTTEAQAPVQESAAEQATQPAEPRQAEAQQGEPAEPPKADATAPIPSGTGDRPEAEPAPARPDDAEGTEARPDEARIPEAAARDQRFAAAHRLIEQGRVSEAADAFRGLLRARGANHFTIQVLIACEPATVQKALAATRGEGDLIVVPFALQGRACYRACWGIHASKQEALDAASSLPAYFAEAARQPVVVSFGRLAPPG
jgi:septal ring-binding cell division protein DamX